MARLKGFAREPRADARARRNSTSLAGSPQFIGSGSVVILDGDGIIQINLDTNSGLQNNSGALGIDLDSTPGLQLGAGGLSALVQGVLSVDGSGILVTIGNGLADSSGTLVIDLATDPGLEFDSGNLRVQTSNGLSRTASGLQVDRIDANGDVVLQSYNDAGRPAAGTAGRVIFNTDDGNINIDDGTNWILPDGTTT